MTNSARFAVALTLGLVGLASLSYGLYGLSVVTGDWLPCLSGQATASLASLPAGYCETTDWVRQFGIGVILTTAGLAGLVGSLRVLQRRGHDGGPVSETG